MNTFNRLSVVCLSLLVLTGCATPAAPQFSFKQASAVKAVKGITTGTVAFALNPGYKTLATQADIKTLAFKLEGAKVNQQKTVSYTKQTVTFDSLPAGTLTLTIEAFDAAQKSLGRTTTSLTIQAGQVTKAPLTLKLTRTAPAASATAPTTGGLEVALTIEEDPAPTPVATPSAPAPTGLTPSAEYLDPTRLGLRNDDPNGIVAAADQALQAGPNPIVGRFTPPPTYVTDGIKDTTADRTQNNQLTRFADHLRWLSRAYVLTGDARYAAHAVKLADAWASKMEPVIVDSQAMICLHDALSPAVVAFTAVKSYAAWNPTQRTRTLRWFHTLAKVSAVREAGRKVQDNGQMWCNMFVCATAVLVEDRALFESSLETWKVNLERQVNAEGYLAHEIVRTKSLKYHRYSLTPQVAQAELAFALGHDLYATPAGKKLEQVLATVGPSLVNPALWPYEELQRAVITPADSLPLYRLAAARFPGNAVITESARQMGASL